MSLSDMTRDGKWLACTKSTRMDSLPRDNSRYGDPTYVAPSQTSIVIISTDTGEEQTVFPEKKQVRSLVWSPDGQTLAFFIFEEGEYVLSLWNRLTGALQKIDTSEYGPIASNSHLFWSDSGGEIHFALRAMD